MIRVVIITHEEPFLVPICISEILRLRRDCIVGIIASRKRRELRPFNLLNIFGLRIFLQFASRYAFFKIRDFVYRFLDIGQAFCVKTLAKKKQVPFFLVDSANSENSLSLISSLCPDLILSVSAGEIFGERLLNIPRLGCLNLHSALLPHNRGLMPVFWSMLNDEKVGVTLHWMVQKVDAGKIVFQKEIKVGAKDAWYNVAKRCKIVSARLAVNAFARIDTGETIRGIEIKKASTYKPFPSNPNVVQFLLQGKRFF